MTRSDGFIAFGHGEAGWLDDMVEGALVCCLPRTIRLSVRLAVVSKLYLT